MSSIEYLPHKSRSTPNQKKRKNEITLNTMVVKIDKINYVVVKIEERDKTVEIKTRRN